MNRKTILTSAILALFAVGQGHADNSFVVKDSNTGKKQLEGKLSTVSRICFKDGKMVVTFGDKSTRELAFTNSTVLYFEGEPTSVTQVVGGAEGLQVMYQGGFVSATGLTSPAHAAIYNISGQRAMSLKAWDGTPVSTDALSSGVYILKVNNKSIKFVKK